MNRLLAGPDGEATCLEAMPPEAIRRQIVSPRGPLTAALADRLLQSLRSISPAPAEVEIDLSRVTAIDRAGATLLLDAYVATLLRRGAFALSGLSPTCRQSLARFGVLDVVQVLDARVPGRVAGRTLS